MLYLSSREATLGEEQWENVAFEIMKSHNVLSIYLQTL